MSAFCAHAGGGVLRGLELFSFISDSVGTSTDKNKAWSLTEALTLSSSFTNLLQFACNHANYMDSILKSREEMVSHLETFGLTDVLPQPFR